MTLTTQWSKIGKLKGRDSTTAWQWFIDRYRDYVAAALRRLIWTSDGAAAASDEFWGYLFQSGALARIEPTVRFRSFLTGILRNYAHDWRRRNPPVRDQVVDDDRPQPDPILAEDEEVALWMCQVLRLALQRLECEQPRQARALRGFYGLPTGVDAAAGPRQGATALAAELGCSANAMHQLLFRARQSLRGCFVDEIRQTVGTRSDFNAELEVMLAALGRATPGLLALERP